MMDPEILLRARPHLHIVHHVPGRVRLRFGPGILDAVPEITTAGEDLLSGLPGIKDLRVNVAAFSLVVSYDQDKLPSAWWEKLIAGSDAEAAEIVAKLRTL